MSFFSGIFDAINDNLLSGGAYTLIIKGILVTFAIVFIAWVLTVLFGGLVSYLMCYDKKLVSRFAEAICFIFRSTPVLLILLLLYYSIFRSVHLNSVIIAGIAVGIYGAGHFAELIARTVRNERKKMVDSADKRLEKSFYTIMLPQALEENIFHLKRLTIHLLQWTTVVGYISINDLTEVMYQIGQRNMYPFFSIFFTIICYIIATIIIELIFKLIQRKISLTEE